MTAIAIIGAMDEEVANIATALSNVTVTESRRGDARHPRNQQGHRRQRCRDRRRHGHRQHRRHHAASDDADQPDAVIFSGIAGNLNTNLHINDVVLGGTLRYLDTDMRLVGQFKPGTADRPRGIPATTVCSNWPTRR